jgi:hypothetical protein
MPRGRLLWPVLVALAATGCARQQQSYVIDPATGQPVPVVMQQQQYAQPQYAQQSYQQPAPQAAAGGERGLFNSWPSAPLVAQQPYAQQTYQPPVSSDGRGLFASPQNAPQAYMQQPMQQVYVMQYGAPQTPQYAPPRNGAPYGAAPKGFASASLY